MAYHCICYYNNLLVLFFAEIMGRSGDSHLDFDTSQAHKLIALLRGIGCLAIFLLAYM